LSVIFVSLVFYSNLGVFSELRELYVETAMTTMSHQYLATTFINQKEIDRIMAKRVKFEEQQVEKTDAAVIKPEVPEDKEEEDNKDIEIKEISEATYKGKLMIVRDPSRVKLAVSKKIRKCGEKLESLISSENAIGGINASGFW
jgi:exopolysaccharide biosynthesis protein